MKKPFLLAACLVAVAACHTSSGTQADGGADASATPAAALITEPDQTMAPVYALMSSAKHTLDMTMYELNDTMATSLLVAAAKNGVTVRVILDQNLEMQDNMTAYAALSAANVTVHWANPIYASTHQKTITVDGTTSAVMTLNFAADEYKTSRDFAFITSDAGDVAAIEATFAADLMDAPVTPSNGTSLVWSPTNAQAALVGIIDGAHTSLLVENEEMSYDAIVSALAKAALRGVDVKIVMEESTTYAANFAALESVGAKVVTYHHAPIYIHAKIILADYGASTASAFLGSENFSRASITENRELGIITSDAATLTSLNATLTSDYAGGKAFVPPSTDAGVSIDASLVNDASVD